VLATMQRGVLLTLGQKNSRKKKTGNENARPKFK